MSNWNVLWKFGGILLLAYVIVAGFGTPLQPGLVEASPDRLVPGPVTLELHAVGQPFATEGASTEGADQRERQLRFYFWGLILIVWVFFSQSSGCEFNW